MRGVWPTFLLCAGVLVSSNTPPSTAYIHSYVSVPALSGPVSRSAVTSTAPHRHGYLLATPKTAHPLTSRRCGARAGRRRWITCVDASFVDSLPHALDLAHTHSHLALSHLDTASVSMFDLASAAGQAGQEIKDAASLADADDTLRTMIKAVDIGPGSDELQKLLVRVVNTPGIRQLLQVFLPPVSIIVTQTINYVLPYYIRFLDVISKTGGHEGLLPEGVDVTMKAVQRLAAQGEILRAFRVLQAAWPTTNLRLGAIAAFFAGFYILAPPGLLFGLFDIYLVSPVDKALETKWAGRDFTIGRQLGGGNFGTVFQATCSEFGKSKLRNQDDTRVVLKRIVTDEEELRKNFAKKTLFGTSLVGGTVARGNFETGKVESYFNERVRRYGFSGSFASYLGAFVGSIRMKDEDKQTLTLSAGQWLVWRYQGEMTVESYINDANFPYCMEPVLFRKSHDDMEDSMRQVVVVKEVIWQVLAALRDMHRVGIVHRDIKPANILVAETLKASPVVKLIDLGAAVDLRTGVNFNPETGLLDPKYAPPEQLVVPQEVPRTPARFIALLFSPALWQLTAPDRFDTYSVGVMLMQMSIPELRPGKQLDLLKSQLQVVGEDLQAWRDEYGDQYTFTLLDRRQGLGWDLVKKLVRPRNLLQRGRLSAAEAMSHPFFWPEFLPAPDRRMKR